MIKIPSFTDYRNQLVSLSSRIIATPVYTWNTYTKQKLLDSKTEVFFKLELLQITGTFKVRGALTFIDNLTAGEKKRGVVAGSAGNHAIAVAFASKSAGVDAKIIVPKTINPFRLGIIKDFSPKLEFVDDVSEILSAMKAVAEEEDRVIFHPFESPYITLGTGTLGVEFYNSVPELEAVIVPVGGGGLASGVASAIKQINPRCKVFGVEPVGASSLKNSMNVGKAVKLSTKPQSIADSLCIARAEPYSFSICKDFLDDVLLVEDQEIKDAMKVLFHYLKLVAEPAGAITTACLLSDKYKGLFLGKKVGVIVCGSNIDQQTFFDLIS